MRDIVSTYLCNFFFFLNFSTSSYVYVHLSTDRFKAIVSQLPRGLPETLWSHTVELWTRSFPTVRCKSLSSVCGSNDLVQGVKRLGC